jgi:hypothetical protein
LRRFLEAPIGRLVFTQEIGQRGRQGEELPQTLNVARRPGELQSLGHPSTGLIGPPRLPGGFRGENERSHRTRRQILLLENPDRRAGFAQGAVDVAGHAVGAGQQRARLALESALAFPLLVEKLEAPSLPLAPPPRG